MDRKFQLKPIWLLPLNRSVAINTDRFARISEIRLVLREEFKLSLIT